MKRYFLVILSLILVTMILAGCSTNSTTITNPTTSQPAQTTITSPTTSPTKTEDTPQSGGTLTVIMLGPPQANFGCTYETVTGDDAVSASPAIESLLRIDPKTNQPIPWLASGWKIGPNNTYLTLTLEKDVMFSDGTPFNADAVKYCLDQYREGSGLELKNVSSIEVVDEHTVQLNMSKWMSYSVSCLAGTAGRMASPAAMKTHDDKWLCLNPIGTGPFTLSSWDGTNMKYDKNTNYWRKGQPYLDHIVMKYVTDQTTGMMDFQAGNSQIDTSITVTNEQRQAMEAEGYKFYVMLTAVSYMLPDSANANSPWSNLKVRQAAAYAINRDQIPPINPMYGNVNQLSWEGLESYNPDVVGYPYNLEKAKQLMDEAGYSKGFNTKLYYPNYDSNLNTAIQAWLGAIGISVELVAIDWGQIMSMIKDGFTNALGYYYMATFPSTDAAQAFQSTLSPNGDMAPSTSIMAYPQSYLDLLEKAINESDATTRANLFKQMQVILIDQQCLMIPTYEGLGPSVRSSKVHNAYIYEYSDTTWHPEEAWLSK